MFDKIKFCKTLNVFSINGKEDSTNIEYVVCIYRVLFHYKHGRRPYDTTHSLVENCGKQQQPRSAADLSADERESKRLCCLHDAILFVQRRWDDGLNIYIFRRMRRRDGA